MTWYFVDTAPKISLKFLNQVLEPVPKMNETASLPFVGYLFCVFNFTEHDEM